MPAWSAVASGLGPSDTGGRLLAHAGAADESLSVVLLFGALWIGWAGWSRWKGTGFPRLPGWAGPALLAAAVAVAVSAAVVPRALFSPTPSGRQTVPSLTQAGPRPSSTARLAFERPAGGEVVADVDLEVVLGLEGGRVIDAATTDLTPDTGHVHLTLDGRLVSMTFGLVQVVDLRGTSAGEHTLMAEFVAADHAPFRPRVTAVLRFRTEAP
ncbi:MAG: hypothetical protein ABWZ53_01660 [Actinomycetota bacterium]